MHMIKLLLCTYKILRWDESSNYVVGITPSSIYSCSIGHIWEHEFCHLGSLGRIRKFLGFIYSENATNLCEIFILLLSYIVPVKSKVKILQKDLGQKMTPVKVRDVLIKS